MDNNENTQEHKIFDEKIQSFDILQLADWINRCRNYVAREYNNRSDSDTYEKMVKSFCDEWSNHYKQNKGFYESEKYQKAILANGIEKNKIIFQEKNDLTEDFFKFINDPPKGMKKLAKDYEDTAYKSIEEYHKFFMTLSDLKPSIDQEDNDQEKTPDYKAKIAEMIDKRRFYDISYNISEIKDDKGRPLDLDEVKKLFSGTSTVSEEVKKLLDLEIDYYTEDQNIKKSKSTPLIKLLKEHNIGKQLYTNYKSKLQIHFEKKFFYNMAFYFSLSAEALEKLMNAHGYSVKYSLHERDVLMWEYFCIGFSQEYVELLTRLRDKNQSNKTTKDSSDNKEKEHFKIQPRKLHNKNKDIFYIDQFKRDSSSVDKKKYIITLESVIERLSKFVEKKRSQLRTNDKNIEKQTKLLEEQKEYLENYENEEFQTSKLYKRYSKWEVSTVEEWYINSKANAGKLQDRRDEILFTFYELENILGDSVIGTSLERVLKLQEIMTFIDKLKKDLKRAKEED